MKIYIIQEVSLNIYRANSLINEHTFHSDFSLAHWSCCDNAKVGRRYVVGIMVVCRWYVGGMSVVCRWYVGDMSVVYRWYVSGMSVYL